MDAHRNKIMKVGDVCIREDNNGLSFLLIVSETNRWNACKQVGHACGNLDLGGNTLLFSFDGMGRRYGIHSIFEKLYELFKEEPLHSFFRNAIDILSYNCDLWEISTFYQILTLTPIEMPSFAQEPQVEYNAYTTVFESYLSEDSKSLFKTLHSESLQLRQIYKEVRNKYPDDFRQAMKKFLNDHPQASIYDKSL